MEQFVVSAIKYRPLTFASVVGQGSIATTLKNAIQRKHLAHAYLFCGPRGVGKTTCARIFAKTINCLTPTEDMEACGKCESCLSFAEGRSYSIHELDAASNNSVEDIRLLIDKVRVPPQIGHYSLYIIDEVHMLSTAAFNAFLKTLEEPPAHAIFILATTEKHKILPTILSRCQIFDFNRITIDDTVKHLAAIAEKEGVACEPEALNIMARKADGAMRDALSIFDRVVSFCGNNITYKAVIEDLNVLDYEYYFRLTDAFLQTRYVDVFMIFDEILRKGFDALNFISGLSSHFRDLLVCKDPKTLSLLEVGPAIAERYRKQAAECPVEFLFEALNLSNQCEVGYKASGNPRLHVELSLMKMANILTEKKNETNEIAPPVQQSTPVPRVTATPPKEEKPKELPVMPQSISLKDMANTTAGKSPEQGSEDNAAPDKSSDVPDGTFTEEELCAAWADYGESIKPKQPRMSSALLEYKPTLNTDGTIDFPVLSEKHRVHFIEKSTTLVEHLRNSLKCTVIKINWIVQEPTEQEQKNKMYTRDDKLKYLIENNPAIDLLRKELDLDFR